ncbi:Hint domain-containing protein [Thalassobius sp. Cn5-15]|uniref:Hint domain-containing protein n=1 Tax=Thalassobius sp. Cn5-15 TaxID=2917763 RepID=UPI001EF296CD|nr:Hint domain-containing protein [Thalassobius sp. Cn5-15]MCG7492345.1 Hint domain-containing protein [Thalassobius sp. Cn5-15]
MSGGSGSGSGGWRGRGGSGSGSGSGGGGGVTPGGGSGSGSGSGSGGGNGGGGLTPLEVGPDGVVRGGETNENIFPGFTDGDGDRVDSGDARLPTESGNDDIIYANGGNDTVNANAGNDYIDAGTGDDEVHGGEGHDVIAGNAGDDVLEADEGDDTVFGGSGDDLINADIGDDVIYGDGNGQPAQNGNLISNGDFSNGRTGWQVIDGNNDDLDPSFTYGSANLNSGRAAAGDGIEQTFATNVGSEHTVSLDLFENNNGAAHHGFRIDVLDQDGNVISSESVAVQNDTVEHVQFTFTATTPNTTLRIINISAAGSHETSDGKVDNVSVVETPVVAGDDTIDGGEGNDLIYAGGGNDVVSGGAHNDTIYGGDGNDSINAGSGNDKVDAGDGNDTVDGGFGTDTMDGGDGIDTVDYSTSFGSDGEYVELDLQAGTGILNGNVNLTESVTNFENAIGSGGTDNISGTSGANSLEGRGGNDTLDGRGGDDILLSGNDDDLVIGGQGIDYQDGGAGNDTVSFDGANGNGISHVHYNMSAGYAQLVNFNNVVVGTETTINFENAIGSSGNDWLVGDDGENQFEGRDGNDLVQGRGGDDTILGEIGNDVLLGDQGDDSIDGGVGHDRLSGGADHDTLLGGEGNDTLQGDDGNDSINGGSGDDSMAGGSGNDTFYGGTGSDTIEGGSGDDTYLADTKVDEYIHAIIDDEGDGTVQEFRGGTIDQVDDVEHYVADETSYDDRITLSTTVTDRSTIQGIDSDVTGVFTPANGDAPISFGGDGEPRLSDILADPFNAGRVTITGGDEAGSIGNISFENFEIIDFDIVCFTKDTQILTAGGYRPVQDLKAGDMVMTVDQGFQPIKWVGNRTVPAHGKFAPVRIEAGVLGNDAPLTVSQQHRMLLSSAQAELMFGEEEVLVPAKALINDQTVRLMPGEEVTYYHVMFDKHQLVYANGAASESFYPGEAAMNGVEAEAQEEIFSLFPELRHEVKPFGEMARPSLSVKEGQLLQ